MLLKSLWWTTTSLWQGDIERWLSLRFHATRQARICSVFGHILPNSTTCRPILAKFRPKLAQIRPNLNNFEQIPAKQGGLKVVPCHRGWTTIRWVHTNADVRAGSGPFSSRPPPAPQRTHCPTLAPATRASSSGRARALRVGARAAVSPLSWAPTCAEAGWGSLRVGVGVQNRDALAPSLHRATAALGSGRGGVGAPAARLLVVRLRGAPPPRLREAGGVARTLLREETLRRGPLVLRVVPDLGGVIPGLGRGVSHSAHSASTAAATVPEEGPQKP